MLSEIVLEFLAFVAASYIGTTMALRGYFGRDYVESELAPEEHGQKENRKSDVANSFLL